MKVIIAAGGSGGHIFPSLALISELEKKGNCKIFFVSSKRKLDRNILQKAKFPCFFLSVNPMPLRFGLISWVIFMLKLFADMIASLFIIVRVRPDVVAGFGGYSSGTIIAAATIFRVPTLIHEQNLVPGRANRILSGLVSRIATSFRETVKYFNNVSNKVVYTGNPLRLDILSNDRIESSRRLGITEWKPTVLIMGGSQGSSFLNDKFSKAAKYINTKKENGVRFIHLTGQKDYLQVKQFYEENGIDSRVFAFLERMDDAYSVSDLVVSRSGAAAIFEIAFYGRAMILVPYPNPKNNQRFNAVYFSERGAAVCKEEKSLSEEDLAKEVLDILHDAPRRESMARSAARLSVPEAGMILAEEVIKLAKKRQ